MPREFGAISDYMEADLCAYELPEDPLWMQPQMLIRHAVAWRGQLDLDGLVKRLDKYGEQMGCRRHGKLEYQSWGDPTNPVHGVSSHFAIVDLYRYVAQIEKFARDSERRAVLGEVSDSASINGVCETPQEESL